MAPLEDRRLAVPAAVWEALRDVKRRASEVMGHGLREVRLFGSYARDQFDEDSDVDVLVLVSSLEPRERTRLVDAIGGIQSGDLILSPMILTDRQLGELRRREAILAEDLDREGIPV